MDAIDNILEKEYINDLDLKIYFLTCANEYNKDIPSHCISPIITNFNISFNQIRSIFDWLDSQNISTTTLLFNLNTLLERDFENNNNAISSARVFEYVNYFELPANYISKLYSFLEEHNVEISYTDDKYFNYDFNDNNNQFKNLFFTSEEPIEDTNDSSNIDVLNEEDETDEDEVKYDYYSSLASEFEDKVYEGFNDESFCLTSDFNDFIKEKNLSEDEAKTFESFLEDEEYFCFYKIDNLPEHIIKMFEDLIINNTLIEQNISEYLETSHIPDEYHDKIFDYFRKKGIKLVDLRDEISKLVNHNDYFSSCFLEMDTLLEENIDNFMAINSIDTSYYEEIEEYCSKKNIEIIPERFYYTLYLTNILINILGGLDFDNIEDIAEDFNLTPNEYEFFMNYVKKINTSDSYTKYFSKPTHNSYLRSMCDFVIKNSQPLTVDKISNCYSRIFDGDITAYIRFIQLSFYIAINYATSVANNTAYSFVDALIIATNGYIKAINEFNYETDISYEEYVNNKIKNTFLLQTVQDANKG